MHHSEPAETRPRRTAAAAVLDAYREGRPIEELRTQLPEELEASGQRAAAEIVRDFFRHPAMSIPRPSPR